jgi:hypothetical protein
MRDGYVRGKAGLPRGPGGASVKVGNRQQLSQRRVGVALARSIEEFLGRQ